MAITAADIYKDVYESATDPTDAVRLLRDALDLAQKFRSNADRYGARYPRFVKVVVHVSQEDESGNQVVFNRYGFNGAPAIDQLLAEGALGHGTPTDNQALLIWQRSVRLGITGYWPGGVAVLISPARYTEYLESLKTEGH